MKLCVGNVKYGHGVHYTPFGMFKGLVFFGGPNDIKVCRGEVVVASQKDGKVYRGVGVSINPETIWGHISKPSSVVLDGEFEIIGDAVWASGIAYVPKRLQP